MRRSMALLSTLMVACAITACGRSSTAPRRCDGATTTGSYLEGETFTGVVTVINFSSGASPVEMMAVRVSGDPDFTIAFSIAASTKVFERSGSSSPASVSACRLEVGQRVELPSSILATGFRDYVPIAGNDPAPPIPPAIDQIVIIS
jgi:hypothetical protein